MAAMSDYLENKLIDWLIRGQAYTAPTSVYLGLLTAAPSDSGAGTEVSGNNYGRATVACSMANFAGTQSAGSTVASSGSGGTTSNNNTISFATPSASWGLVTHFGVYDAVSGGNLLFYGTLGTSKTINSGDTVSFAAAALTIQIDN